PYQSSYSSATPRSVDLPFVVDAVVGNLHGTGVDVRVSVVTIIRIGKSILINVVVQSCGIAVVVDAVVGNLHDTWIDAGIVVITILIGSEPILVKIYNADPIM